jgi:hypothetical protein
MKGDPGTDPVAARNAEWEKQKKQKTKEAAKGNRPTPGGEKPIRFKFTQFRDIKLDTAPAYIVDQMLPRVGVVVVWGKPKSGKTFWTFDLEMHIALGWDYRDRRVEQGTVLHIACEGVSGLGARREAWRLHHTHNKEPNEIEYIDAAPFYLCKNTALDLIKEADKVIADIDAQFGDQPIRVITVDTLNRSLKGSESKDEDMAAYLSAAILIAEKFQCLVIIIHHCGHGEDRPRGHSSLLGNTDALIEIKKDGAGIVCSKVEEMRDGPLGAVTRSLLQVIEVTRDDNGNPITSCVIVEADPGNPTARKTKHKLSPLDKIALDTLKRAIGAHGTPPPPTDYIPSYATVVSTDLWRRFYLMGTSSDNEKEDTRRAAWRRSRDRLIAEEIVGFCDDSVWII